MKYFISAGEHSGDMHGAALIKAILEQDPEARIYGMGGPLMAAAGAEILHDPTAKGTIGFVEVLKNYRFFKKLLDRFEANWQTDRPDLVIWVDFGGFNLALAERARRNRIPVLCIFSPSAWAYGLKRAVRMGDCVTRLAAVLPFEADFYEKMGLQVTRVGHPLIDRVKPTCTREAFRAGLNIGETQPLVALLPGSRKQEIARLLPLLMDAVEEIIQEHPETTFVLPVASSIDKSEVKSALDSKGLTQVILTDGGAYDLMNAADLGLIASGTATLEAALLEMPMIVFYKVNNLSFRIYNILRNPEHRRTQKFRIGLPNLVAGEDVVPELVQEHCNGSSMARETLCFLNDPNLLSETRKNLKGLKERVGPPSVMTRVASIATELAKSKSRTTDRFE